MIDLKGNLIESNKRKKKGGWKAYLGSIGLHLLIIAFIVFMGAAATSKVDAEKPIRAFLSQGAAPPPPRPPPPPPPAASSTPKTPTPTVKAVQVPHFVQPTEIPKELPKVEAPTSAAVVDTTPAQPSQPAGEAGGVPGGVVGGVAGGVQGGVVGGQIGGQLGGELGGVVGGKVGGEKEAAPKPDGPLRVGGDVKAPIVTRRVQPNYTEVARKGRIQGIVIVEAIIDKDGNVDHVKVLKGLPMGLSEEAESAVKKWKFRPGTLGGQPVDVIFNLTVNFTLDSGGPATREAPAVKIENPTSTTETTSTQ